MRPSTWASAISDRAAARRTASRFRVWAIASTSPTAARSGEREHLGRMGGQRGRARLVTKRHGPGPSMRSASEADGADHHELEQAPDPVHRQRRGSCRSRRRASPVLELHALDDDAVTALGVGAHGISTRRWSGRSAAGQACRRHRPSPVTLAGSPCSGVRTAPPVELLRRGGRGLRILVAAPPARGAGRVGGGLRGG